MRKYLLLIAVVLSVSSASYSQSSPKWPKITQESKPWSRWWWLGSGVDHKNLTAAMEQYSAAGLGGLEITPIYGAKGSEDRFLDFLSPKWMDEFTYTLDEAKRLGMGIDLANASGWPFGGPWVDEEDACKNFSSVTYKLRGGQTLAEPVKFRQEALVRAIGKRVSIDDIKAPVVANPNLQEYAFEQVRYPKDLPLIILTANSAKGEVIDLTSKVGSDGKLDWVAPEGDWTLCAMFLGWHGKLVERAGPGGEGDVIDHFSRPAIDHYLKKFDDSFKGYDLSYLRYYFNDSYEVDDATGESNWTPEFFTEFSQLRGYDLKQYLPALLGLDTPEMNSRVRYDYRLTINDLLLERYSKPWQQWAAAQGKGIRNQAHGSPANVLDLYAVSDVPEIEGQDILTIKGAPSAAHVTGKNLISSESATWLGEHFESSLGDVKTAMDRFLLGGVNHTFYHGTCYSPQDAQWPGWLFYAAVHFNPQNSFWPDFGAFNAYVARCQSFMQAGKPDNDILLYYAISDVWSRPERAMLQHFHGLDRMFNGTPLRAMAQNMQDKGYAWDLISDKQILGLSVSGGELKTGGVSYKTIIIPQCGVIPFDTFDKIVKLAYSGATVLVQGSLPGDVAGFADLEKKRSELKSLVSKLSFTENNGVKTALYGKGRIVVGNDVETLLASTKVRREAMYDSGLQNIRRAKNGGEYYFVVNDTTKTFKGWVNLNTQAKSAALFDPMTGKSGYASVTQNSDGTIDVYLQMNKGESVIIETFKGKHKPSYDFYYVGNGPVVELKSDWEVSFVAGGPELPAKRTVKELGSWTEYDGDIFKKFSGSAEYTTTVSGIRDAGKSRIDLGRVEESAAVYINGVYVTTLFSAPYILDASLKNGDKLTVRVSNSMANRISDLDRNGVNWRIFYNTNFPARRGENRGADGLFSAARWQPRPSGLIGPITVQSLVPTVPAIITTTTISTKEGIKRETSHR